MPEPMDDEAFQKIGTAEERAVERRRAADHNVVAPAGPGMLAVDHELVGAEAGEPRLLVDRLGRRDAFAPARRRVDVDLDDAGIGRDADDVQARIDRRRIALDLHRQPDLLGRRPPPRRPVRDSPPAASTGGRKTQRCPSRASTVTAVRTAPSMSPSPARPAPAGPPPPAANEATRWARCAQDLRTSGRGPRGSVGSASTT